MRPSNDYYFMRKGPRRDARAENERRAAIARAAMAPRDLSPAPQGTVKALRTAWRAFCVSNDAGAYRTRDAHLGRVRIPTRGVLSATLRRGDMVLVWEDQRRTRAPMYFVWHPRNPIVASVSREQVDLVSEEPRQQGSTNLPSRRGKARPKKHSR